MDEYRVYRKRGSARGVRRWGEGVNCIASLGCHREWDTSKCHWERRNVQLLHDTAFQLRFLFITYWQSYLRLTCTWRFMIYISDVHHKSKAKSAWGNSSMFFRQTPLSHFWTQVRPPSVVIWPAGVLWMRSECLCHLWISSKPFYDFRCGGSLDLTRSCLQKVSRQCLILSSQGH